MTEAILILLALLAFGVIHSLTASPLVKHRTRAWIGTRAYEGWYRLLYNIFSGITFLPVLALMALQPGPDVWRAQGVAAGILVSVQVGSLIALALTALQFDVWRFAGVRQAWAYLNGDPLPLPPEPFVQRGMYGLVRHPLYLFSTLYIWTFPAMSAAQVAFAAGATLYFVVGARLEERRLAREIGPDYARYRCRVPFLIPFIAAAPCPESSDAPGTDTTGIMTSQK